mmetsp:Transcript_106581/g.147552  ORF Transcript_106581/g.147552 Transcript_106581/m.147552 type:complete len:193 (-) Transcript_106581:204-782(-)
MYTHTNCPFSERARLAFAARKIPYQWVEVDLQKKADWHLAANGGTVPLLETQDGTFIPDSGILMNFATEYTKGKEGHQLIPENAVTAAKMRLAMEEFNKLLSDTGFWPAFGPNSWFKEECNEKFASNMHRIEEFVKKHTDGKTFMSGNSESACMLDIHCFTLLARMVYTKVDCLKQNVYDKWGFAEKLAVTH